MINETADLIIQTTKADIYNPVVISMWVSTLIIFGLVTYLNSLGHKTKWDNFWRIWLWTAIGSGVLVTIYVMSPVTVSEIINGVKSFIGI